MFPGGEKLGWWLGAVRLDLDTRIQPWAASLRRLSIGREMISTNPISRCNE
ncbi:hypothetical protein [Paracoccus tegillarcae]|uniref:hypothetical protein n=1 Tax=Paracoccus tegillarcae TaxID=1529068 RepID=UPI003BAE2C8A